MMNSDPNILKTFSILWFSLGFIQSASAESPLIYWKTKNMKVSESIQTAILTISSNMAVKSDITVNYSVSGDAVLGQDYSIPVWNSFVIPAQKTTAYLFVTIINNSIVQPNRQLVFTLTQANSNDSSVTPILPTLSPRRDLRLTIVDDDPLPDTTSPTIPSSLQGYAIDSSDVILHWQPSSDNPGGSGILGYQIIRDNVVIGQTADSVTSYQDTQLTPNTAYQYAISAVDNAGNGSTLSSPITVITPAIAKPILAYSFDEGMGLILGDASENKNNGLLFNLGRWISNGKYGGGLAMNGINSYAVVKSTPQFISAQQAFSVTMWFAALGNNDDGGFQTLINQGGSGQDKILHLLIDPTKHLLRFPDFDSGYVVSDKNWHHLTYTYTPLLLNSGQKSRASNQIGIESIYMDGRLQNTRQGLVPNTDYRNSPLTLGGAITRDYQAIDENFNGGLDNLRLYGQALSFGEVQNDMNSSVPFATIEPIGNICPTPTTPQFIAYQSDETTVELVLPTNSISGADHYEIIRSEGIGNPSKRLLPLQISSATPSITDQGEGLVNGKTYQYSLAVINEDGKTIATAIATGVDVGKVPYASLGSPFLVGHIFGGEDMGAPNDAENSLSGFPSPINRTYAKYMSTARDPKSNVALPCAQVTVLNSSSGKPIPLFADRFGKYPYPNPMIANRDGRYEFYVENSSYDIQFSTANRNYQLSGVAIFDPRAAQVAKVEKTSAIRLVTHDIAAGPDANIPVKFIRRGWLPFRLLAQDSVNSWAFVFNSGWDESNQTWKLDSPSNTATFLRINQQTHALEYALDQSYGAIDGAWTDHYLPRFAPNFETLFYFGLDRTHLKSYYSAPITIDAIAGEAGLRPGMVVHFNSNGTVSHTQGREMNTFILANSNPSVSTLGSTVRVIIAGQAVASVLGHYNIGDPFISGPNGQAAAAPNEIDSRYILGYALSVGGSANTYSTDYAIRVK